MNSISLYELYLQRTGIKAGGTLLGYCPPDIQWANETDITIPVGRYYKVGSRAKGQYDMFDGRGVYWDVESPFTLTFSGGILDGGLVYPNWYSVFMVGPTAEDIQILPFIRVYSVDYDVSHSGKTTIIPGNQNVAYWDTQVEQTGYINTDDSWNGYRLRRWTNNLASMWNAESPLLIEDTINSTSDNLVVDGNVLSAYSIAAGNCFQLLPPSSTPHLYLGAIWIDGNSHVIRFFKRGWSYYWHSWRTVSAVKGAPGAAGNTFAYLIPPNAQKVRFSHYLGDDDTNYSYGGYAWFYSGDSGESTDSWTPAGNNTHNLWNYYSHRTQYKRSRQTMEFNLTHNQCIRNLFSRYDSAWYAPEFGNINIYGWAE